METLDNNSPTTSFNEMQTIKRRLFAMRNGVIADVLRRGGSPFRIIFGVNLPQLVEIAAESPHTVELANKLWENKSTRESRLIAPMIYPRDKFSRATALEWIDDIECVEVADLLCHRLLRHQNYATDLATEILESETSGDIQRYTAIRLLFNLIANNTQLAAKYAKKELLRNCPLTSKVSKMLADEADFLSNEMFVS